MSKNKKEILNEIIVGYRKVISDKYDYENLKKRSDIPNAYTEETAIKFKNYFLNYSYPSFEKRQVLNDAFKNLDNYLKRPEKLLRILVDSTRILFKYGKHLPKILNAGIKALKAFRKAGKLEEALTKKAMLADIETPYTKQQINELLKKLSKEELEEYINSIYDLFNILRDTNLVSKIKNILSHLISKMKIRPKIYTKQEIKGLEVGQEIIVEADAIFNKFNMEDQLKIFNFIIKMEKEMLEI